MDRVILGKIRPKGKSVIHNPTLDEGEVNAWSSTQDNGRELKPSSFCKFVYVSSGTIAQNSIPYKRKTLLEGRFGPRAERDVTLLPMFHLILFYFRWDLDLLDDLSLLLILDTFLLQSLQNGATVTGMFSGQDKISSKIDHEDQCGKDRSRFEAFRLREPLNLSMARAN